MRPSYLGPVVVAQRGTPAHPTYLNELPPLLSCVRSLLPIDMTLDWANPYNVDCLPDDAGNYTNPVCGHFALQGTGSDRLPYPWRRVPPACSDGGPDSWFTQGNVESLAQAFSGNTLDYPNGQEEATIWFHPHGFGITRLNVFAGMAGVYPSMAGQSAAYHHAGVPAARHPPHYPGQKL